MLVPIMSGYVSRDKLENLDIIALCLLVVCAAFGHLRLPEGPELTDDTAISSMN